MKPAAAATEAWASFIFSTTCTASLPPSSADLPTCWLEVAAVWVLCATWLVFWDIWLITCTAWLMFDDDCEVICCRDFEDAATWSEDCRVCEMRLERLSRNRLNAWLNWPTSS